MAISSQMWKSSHSSSNISSRSPSLESLSTVRSKKSPHSAAGWKVHGEVMETQDAEQVSHWVEYI